ncbi:MAG: hypothetical protein A3F72_12830 [Bacteroidetes bacterium RIFCSPLOWO2_12_FULL_35_15]|nr:MAG: hypothetical protein A3F72_12830 [Bacteroidetes bacterium RIFCSPLOWO2_12_FULL_35_15]
MDTFKKQWLELAKKYSSDELLINQCYDTLCYGYYEPERYYHNMQHIQSMLEEIYNCKNNSLDIDSLLFATWFHDVSYNPKSHTNEAESAALAIVLLKQLDVPEVKIQTVQKLILSTINHTKATNSDTNLNFFLDCDLKILGATKEEYMLYAENIRKEYKHVIGFIYRMERKKVLKRFIESASIYRTDYFRNKYEEQARSNILFEIKNL